MDMSTLPIPVAVPLQGGQGTAMADPLAQLRDIHLPGPVESWPPAIGWWILLAIILLLVLAVFKLAVPTLACETGIDVKP